MIVKCANCRADTGEYAPVNTTVVKLCEKCKAEEDAKAIEMSFPKMGDPCVNCKTRTSTIWWVGDGGIMAWAHGGGEPWCEYCSVAEQLKHAKAMAAKIPELETKLKELEDGKLTHYAIFSEYEDIGQIGCCYGEEGKADVLSEEPEATFKAIPKEECKVCNE